MCDEEQKNAGTRTVLRDSEHCSSREILMHPIIHPSSLCDNLKKVTATSEDKNWVFITQCGHEMSSFK